MLAALPSVLSSLALSMGLDSWRPHRRVGVKPYLCICKTFDIEKNSRCQLRYEPQRLEDGAKVLWQQGLPRIR